MSYFGNNNAFGIVTVMDAHIYNYEDVKDIIEGANAKPSNIVAGLANKVEIATLKYLQVATLSTEGPSITINGGKYNNPLIKYGKTARCEMTDALGEPKALIALGGAEMDSDGNLSITDKFGAPVCILGDTFIVDQATGKHVPLKILLYKFLPDSTPSFAFDSGNAATFDLNGDLLAVELGGEADEPLEGEPCDDGNGTFFSFVPVNCDLEPVVGDKWASIIYGGKMSGPSRMKIGQEYTLIKGAGGELTDPWANDLDTGDSLNQYIQDLKITLPTGVKRVLISDAQ